MADMLRAVTDGDAELIKSLLAAGTSANMETHRGPLLAYAIVQCQPRAVAALLEGGADIYRKAPNSIEGIGGKTALEVSKIIEAHQAAKEDSAKKEMASQCRVLLLERRKPQRANAAHVRGLSRECVWAMRTRWCALVLVFWNSVQ